MAQKHAMTEEQIDFVKECTKEILPTCLEHHLAQHEGEISSTEEGMKIARMAAQDAVATAEKASDELKHAIQYYNS